MPRNALEGLPFPPLVVVDTDEPLSEEQLRELLESRPEGLSLCVRSISGHEQRGGYFFHLLPMKDKDGNYGLYDFEKTCVTRLTLQQVTSFVNHCTGLAFDDEAFLLCQRVINFRPDPQSE